MIVFDAARYVVAPQQAVEGLRRAVKQGRGAAPQQRVGIFDMVAVVVGQYDAFDAVDVDAVVQQLVGDIVVVDAGVYEYAAGAGADICAVAAAAAAERYEFDVTSRTGGRGCRRSGFWQSLWPRWRGGGV